MSKLVGLLKGRPVIAAVRKTELLDEAISSRTGAVFFLTGDLLNLKEMVNRVKEGNKPVFIHLDLIEGLGQDKAAVQYLAKEVGPTGVITIRTQIIPAIKQAGMIAIQRVFALDSYGLETGITNIKSSCPDAVEVLPAVIPKVIQMLSRRLRQPVITSGLVSSAQEIKQAIAAGALAVSVSDNLLWNAF